MTITRTKSDGMVIEEYGNVINIYPIPKSSSTVTVYKAAEYRQLTSRKAEVNWSALGSCTPEEAEAYAKGIMKAAEIAKELNG